jgi:protein-disulfide isomerase-like protein with CxxC motif
MDQMQAFIELTEYTDPYCTWCWGSEPILRRIEWVYGEQVGIHFVMGGLVEDMGSFHDPLNAIGGPRWHEQVAAHWLDASQRHGMPVDAGIFQDTKDEFRSTYPACIAYKAAEFQDEALAVKYLRRLREAAAAERRPIHREEVQAQLAAEVGLDVQQLLADLQGGRARQAFTAGLKDCRSRGITGFPTFLLKNQEGQEVLLRGYHRFEAFEGAFHHLAGDALVPRPVQADDAGILAFVQAYAKIAPREVAEAFALTTEAARDWLRQLESKGLVNEQKAGNGAFYLRAG